MNIRSLLIGLVACTACSPSDGPQKVAAQPSESPVQCMKDIECKGDRICENGSCVAPMTTDNKKLISQQKPQSTTSSARPIVPESVSDPSSDLLKESISLDRSKRGYLSKLQALINELIKNDAIPRAPALVLDDKTTFYIPSRAIEIGGARVVAIEHRYNMEYLGGPPVFGITVLLDAQKKLYILEGIARTYKCEVTPLQDSYSDMESFVKIKLPTRLSSSLVELSCTTRV